MANTEDIINIYRKTEDKKPTLINRLFKIIILIIISFVSFLIPFVGVPLYIISKNDQSKSSIIIGICTWLGIILYISIIIWLFALGGIYTVLKEKQWIFLYEI